MASSENFDVILNLLLKDKDARQAATNAAKAFSDLEDSVETANERLTKQKGILDDLKKSLTNLKTKQKEYVKGSDDYNYIDGQIKKVTASIDAQTDMVEREKVEYSKLRDQMQKTQKEQQDSIALMGKQAGALNALAGARAKELDQLRKQADLLEKGSQTLFTVGAAGLTSITLLAKKYIDSTEESNEITKAWAASTEKVSDAQMRIGKIAAEAVLPIYEKLADIAQKGAEFIEKNPGAIEAGLKTSIVLAGLGGIGTLAAKGMRLYADVQMIAVGDMQLLAAKIMSDAATKQLAAAGGGGGIAKSVGVGGKVATVTTGTAAATGSSAIASVASAAFLIAAPTIAAILTKEVGNAMQRAVGAKESTWGDIGTTFTQAVQLPIKFALLGLSQVAPNVAAKINDIQNALWSWTGIFAESSDAVNKNTSEVMQNAQATAKNSQANAQATNAANNATAATKGLSNGLGGIGVSISNFIQRIISAIGGGSNNPPKHDYTGYAYTRTYAMAQDGKRQFVMSGSMTRLAEQMLGSQLNEQMVMSALTAGAGRGSVTWNDQRRFSGEYTKAMRNAQRRDTLEIFAQVAKEIK